MGSVAASSLRVAEGPGPLPRPTTCAHHGLTGHAELSKGLLAWPLQGSSRGPPPTLLVLCFPWLRKGLKNLRLCGLNHLQASQLQCT